MTTVVNGRFLRARPTGLHRVGRSLLDAASAAGLETEVLAPAGVADPRVDRTLVAPGGGRRAGDHAWEQVALPLAARGRRVLSLANTAPLAAGNSVLLVHDVAPLVGAHWFARSMRAYGRLVVAGARRARIVLAVSAQVADDLAGVGVDRDRVRVVRPAVDDGFGPAPAGDIERVRRTYRLDRPYALHVGWADPRKDAAVLVEAHLRVLPLLGHDLVLVGAGHPNFAAVRLPEVPSVRRIGYVGDDDLRALLTGAAVFAYPSRYEGFGLPPLEAMACGTPAVVADVAALRESTAGSATVVPPGDVAALAAALLRGLDGELAPPVPPLWSWADAAGQLLDALDS